MLALVSAEPLGPLRLVTVSYFPRPLLRVAHYARTHLRFSRRHYYGLREVSKCSGPALCPRHPKHSAVLTEGVGKTGQTGVPVIKIGNRWIVRFDKERIEKELGLD